MIGKSITLNEAICGKLSESSDYRKVKMLEIETIRKEALTKRDMIRKRREHKKRGFRTELNQSGNNED